MKIYIPSYNRAGDVTTYDFFGKDCYIVIPVSQLEDYKKHYPETNLITIPDEKDGNVGRKRNAILDLADDDEILMIDDDLKKFIDIDKQKAMTKEQMMFYFWQGFQFLKDSDLKLFGFSNNGQRIRVRPFHPLSLTKPFWWVMGIKRTKLRFDEMIERGEDVDFWLKHLKRDRATIRFNLIFPEFKTKNAKRSGGIESQTESGKDILALQKRWGSQIINVENGVIKSIRTPIKGL